MSLRERKRSITVFCACSVLLFGAPAVLNNIVFAAQENLHSHEEVSEAMSLMQTDRSAAVERLRELADLGSASAMLRYGQYAVDFVHGLTYIKQAADMGYAPAQRELGNLYRVGRLPHVPKDAEKAIEWLTKAADNGEGLQLGRSMARERALFRLSYMYEVGELVQINPELSSEYMQKAIELQAFSAAELFGYATEGFQDSYRYTRLAAEMGHSDAQTNLAQWQVYGFEEFNAPELEAYEIPQDATQALKWLDLAASAGNVRAYETMGDIYRRGIRAGDRYLLERDGLKSVKYYRWAAQRGSDSARELLEGIGKMRIVRQWDDGHNDTLTNQYSNTLDYTYFTSRVSRNRGGEKNVFFEISHAHTPACSVDRSSQRSGAVWSFAGQAIKMFVYCAEDEYGGNHRLTAIADTDQGQKYVVDLFKRSVEPILVKGASFEFPLSAAGFTKVWNGSSEEAL